MRIAAQVSVAALLGLAGCGSPSQVAQSAPDQANRVGNGAAARVERPPEVGLALVDGQCAVQWRGGRVNGAQLLERAVATLEAAITRVGIDRVTEAQLEVRVVGTAETPWRCIGGAVHQLRRSGYAKIAFDLDPGSPRPQAYVALPIYVDLPIDDSNAPPAVVDPQRNRIVVRADGNILWNGVPVEPMTLRQYLEITTTLTPTPELQVEVAGAARYDAVLAMLDVVRQARVPMGSAPLQSGRDLQSFDVEEPPPPEEEPPPPGGAAPPRPPEIVAPPAAAGDIFELVGLEAFVADLR